MAANDDDDNLSLVNCATESIGDDKFCYCNTCSENEGDCDSHDECQDGLKCGLKNCQSSLGFDSEVDCCFHGIISPNFPNSYPNNAKEEWQLTAPTGSIIILQFHSFYVRHIVESIKIQLCRYEFIFILFHRLKHPLYIMIQ